MATQLSCTARALGAIAACIVLAAPAQAQERRHEERREFVHERYANPHWVYDDRFHHNHYYPAAGYSVNLLPPAYATVWAGGRPYYYANDVYYVREPGGFVVAAPPMEAAAPQPAPQAQGAPSQAPGSWYYCDSTKAYYPFVQNCLEGWRTVPAAPPPR